MSSHTRIQQVLADFVLEKLSDVDRRVVSNHLTSCAACRREHDEMVAVLQKIRMRTIPEPDTRYWSTVLPRIHERLHASQRTRAPRWLTRLVAPAAAMLLLTLVVIRFFAPVDESSPLQSIVENIDSASAADYLAGNADAWMLGLVAAEPHVIFDDDDSIIIATLLDAPREAMTIFGDVDDQALDALPSESRERLAALLEQGAQPMTN